MKPVTAIGLMSGTSMDGIDLAVLTTDGEALVERGPSHFVPYEAAFRRRLEAALETAKAIGDRTERPGDLAAVEDEVSRRHAVAVNAFAGRLAAQGIVPELVGFHGQTVLHRPEDALTVQLGKGDIVARETGLATVYDMRANDMAHGGQGAPLVPAYHAALARQLPEEFAGLFPVAFVNIGGIANISYIAREGDPIAFDTGPGNALIDQWVAGEGGIPFDADGMVASEGGVVGGVVATYLENPYFEKAGPKSLDRGDFTLEPARGLDLSDGARTLAAVSAESILKAVEHLPEMPALWIVCGGGRKNPHIMQDLEAGAQKQGSRVVSAEAAGFDGDAMEAEAWAYLAVRSVRGLPLTFPTTTGCREAVTGGVLAAAPS